MQVETKFNIGDIVFYADHSVLTILKRTIKGIGVIVDNNGKVEVTYYFKEPYFAEAKIYASRDELKSYLYGKINELE